MYIKVYVYTYIYIHIYVHICMYIVSLENITCSEGSDPIQFSPLDPSSHPLRRTTVSFRRLLLFFFNYYYPNPAFEYLFCIDI